MYFRLFKLYLHLIFICYCFFSGCTQETEQKQVLFELLPSSYTGIQFKNNIVESDSLSILTFEYIYNGGGVAIGDINNDNLPDIYFTGNQQSGKLYLNKGDMKFEDITQKAGVQTKLWSEGVAMVDINNDHLLDIYISTSSRNNAFPAHNLLFINKGNLTFTEESAAYGLADTGYNTQAAFFDYDHDHDLDVYLLSNAIEGFNRNITRPKKTKGEGKSTDKLYRNNGNGTFTNVSAEAGILIEGYGLGIATGDLNKDGWTDVYTSNDFLSNDLIWINNGKGSFTNKISTMLKHQSYNGMGVDIADFNNDALPDIIGLDMLPETNKRQKLMFGSMNYDRFRLNLDMGYEPQYVRNTLQLNNGNNTFSEIGQLAGVHNTDWSWNALFADYDNDGWKDLLITNGYGKDITDQDYTVYSRAVSQFGTEQSIKMQLVEGLEQISEVKLPNYLYKNNGNLTFSDKSADWGMVHASISNGAAYSDLDNDGDLDLVVNNLNEEAFIYRNASEKLIKNNFLKIKLLGDSLNAYGIGAKILLKHQGKKQYYEHYLSRGYKSSMDPIIHFGMGNIHTVDSIEITWPDGKYELITNVPCNQRITLEYKNAGTEQETITVSNTLFQEVSAKTGIQYKHQEKDFVDFSRQPLIPFKHSQNGPGLAVADIDGNGLEDFYVGGASGQPGTLFYQQPDGKFKSRILQQQTKYEEEMGVLFFDADGDTDQDLYVVSGGSEFPQQSRYYQDQLYINDGKGNFSKDSLALPDNTTSGSCVIAADYDKDGDLDLFVGGRVSPARYPLVPRSYVLENNQGKFTDVTDKICSQLKEVGMVTSALWTDFDNDSQIDLVIAGEWMPVSFFKNVQGKLVLWNADEGKVSPQSTVDSPQKNSSSENKSLNHPITHSLSASSGWWNSIAAGDFDNDGDTDYVLGNLGLNSKFKATMQEPVSMYAKDFDSNGSLDPVLSYYIQGKNYPAHPRDDMIDQIIPMRGRFPRYADYASATIDQVFTSEELQGTYVLKAYQLQSSYAENLGNGKFRLKPLPMEAQFAPVFGILPGDFNGDGNLDLLLSGNSYASEILTGWYDASIGLYMEGDGKGNFKPVHVNKSGFMIEKDAKALVQLYTSKNQPLLIASNNNDSLRVFSMSEVSLKQIIPVKSNEIYADLLLQNGKKQRQELYYGAGYLAQSSRQLWVSKHVKQVKIVNISGESRILIPFQENLANR
ncbi:VCBS repeat-containing protein [Rhodocytophaga rosea]|uniref:VCBS repeat-containing protein n=1 Tax=Rhodocytophaga rosea TaxID=2704465 RepID=A0A6C0GKK9_9BACT|nr:VCBS repeat-containing protein [Rhodocytophaga rosea]QHT68170.1 VCBS repeat-containing protein [Rhodocytophaga rosea]